MEHDKFVAGEFVWTGFDYLGEPTPFDRQAKSSYFGIVDLCGMPKDRYYLYRSYWRPDTTTVHILPHWNWPDRVGQTCPCSSTPTATAPSCSSTASRWADGKKVTRRAAPCERRRGKPATASSTRGDRLHQDKRTMTGTGCWRAAQNKPGEWWQVDLGRVQPIADVVIGFDGPAQITIPNHVSDDGPTGRPSPSKATSQERGRPAGSRRRR